MTPSKVDHGRPANKEQESQWAGSQKQWSQSWPRDEADPKKGRTEGEGKSGKVQVSIDWTTMGIWKPVSKPDSHPPSFKPDVSEASGDQLPRMKSTVVKGSQRHTSGSWDRTCGQEGDLPVPLPTHSQVNQRRRNLGTSLTDGSSPGLNT